MRDCGESNMHLLLALLLSLLLAGCASQPPVLPAPPIVAVATWGGSPGAAPAEPQRIDHITLHHQGESWVVGRDPAAYLRRLQQWSRRTKGWADIPYHYVIAPDGQIYAARDLGLAGDTNTEYDPRGHALVMLLGNFEEVEPSREQLLATAELMAWLAQAHGLSERSIASHKDHSSQTVCPGRHLYAHLQSGWLQGAVAARLRGRAMSLPGG